jgi:hypothetical protein
VWPGFLAVPGLTVPGAAGGRKETGGLDRGVSGQVSLAVTRRARARASPPGPPPAVFSRPGSDGCGW